MTSRFPKWIIDAKNRDEILKAINKLHHKMAGSQPVQPEPRAARFVKSTSVGRGPVNRVVRRQSVTGNND
jgi:hypothetical protein